MESYICTIMNISPTPKNESGNKTKLFKLNSFIFLHFSKFLKNYFLSFKSSVEKHYSLQQMGSESGSYLF